MTSAFGLSMEQNSSRTGKYLCLSVKSVGANVVAASASDDGAHCFLYPFMKIITQLW